LIAAIVADRLSRYFHIMLMALTSEK